jgi:lambda repressor-like predicted transcriptional regulator
VDLVRAYSNPSDQVEHLRALMELPRAVRRERRQRPPKQAQTRLDREEIAHLVAAYQAGGRIKQLARQFGIHRLTVSSILQRQGVTLRSRGIHPDDLPEVIRPYEDGWALARLAVKFDVSPSTVTNTLRGADVPIRRPGRPPIR